MIELKYFEQSDFKQLIEWSGSPEFLMQWSGPSFTYPLDESQLINYINEANTEDSNIFIYKAILTSTGKTIGHVSLVNLDRKNNSARIGRVLLGDTSVRGQGLGVKMIEEVLRIAFEDLKLHRVSLGVFDFNKSAIACYEKAGFKKDGLLRDIRKIGDQYWSLYEMSILENEWHK